MPYSFPLPDGKYAVVFDIAYESDWVFHYYASKGGALLMSAATAVYSGVDSRDQAYIDVCTQLGLTPVSPTPDE